MFGQEPRLPVDFLMGRVEEPVCCKVNEWVQEHQSRLRVAFEGARDKLKVAMEHRKTHHDQHVRDVPLEEGQLVWLRDFNRRGRHKIQDRWCFMVYRVVQAPTELQDGLYGPQLVNILIFTISQDSWWDWFREQQMYSILHLMQC